MQHPFPQTSRFGSLELGDFDAAGSMSSGNPVGKVFATPGGILSVIAWFRKPTWQPVVTLKELLQSFPPVLGRRYTMCL